MRIGLVTTSFPRHVDDIAGRFVLEMAQSLASRGHAIQVLAPEPAEPQQPPEWPGISLRWVSYLRPRSLQQTFYGAGVPDNLRRTPAAWLGLLPFSHALRRAVHDAAHGWDAVISHWALPSALASAMAAPHLPHLAISHSADIHLLERLPMRSFMARTILQQARAVVAVAPSLRTRLLRLLSEDDRAQFSDRCHALPMGVHAPAATTSDRSALRAALGLRRFTLLSIARLVPVKGLAHAIQACAGRSDLELVVLGDGPERATLEQLARATGAAVRFEGRRLGADKAAWLQAADAYLCPSLVTATGRTEGMPHAVTEALASGLPVISSAVGGLADWLQHGRHAWLLPSHTPRDITQAVDRLRLDPTLRLQLADNGRLLTRPWLWPSWAAYIENWLATPA